MYRKQAIHVSVLLMAVVAMIAFAASPADATIYNVGPGQAYTNIIDVPWESLTAGDTVNIYYRATPYKEKFIITGVGTPTQPITIHGVPGPGGELPVIDGQDAVSRQALSVGSEGRGIICMQQGDATTIPPTCNAQYVVIENLELKNASTPYTFTDDSGVIQSYSASAAGVWSVNGYNVTVRNCYIHDCGNGIMTYCLDDGATNWTQDWLIEGNYIANCGNAGSTQEHGTYTETMRITYQYNRYSPPRGGDTQTIGNGLKDRSAGLVVRYNWIEGGNRCIDAIDCEDSTRLGLSPEWDKTFIYGNVFIERPDMGNRQVIHFGKDMRAEPRHKGYFYNNTVVSLRTGTDRTTLVRESGASSGFFDVRNCVIYVPDAGSNLEITNDSRNCGPVNIRNCWMKPGYVAVGPSGGTVNDSGSHVLGTDPGFVSLAGQDFQLAAGSGCINAGTMLHADASAYPVTLQYVKHQGSMARPNDGQIDIGAFEAVAGPPANLVITTSSLPGGAVGTAYSATVAATGGVSPYAWSVISGALPNGLSLNGSTGAITGTPTTQGTANFVVYVADAQVPSDSDSKSLSITISGAAPLNITTTTLPNAKRNKSYSTTLAATGGTTPYAWTVVGGALPNGLTLNPSTGVISGKATTTGTYNFTVRCTDSAAPAATDDQPLVLVVTV